MPIRDWSLVAADNDSAPPNGWPEGQAPSSVNNVGRQMMADIRSAFEEIPFFDFGHVPTRIDDDTFSVPTDLTTLYSTDRRVKLVGATTEYATITTASYSFPDTTVNVVMDSGAVPTSLTQVSVSQTENIVTQGLIGSLLYPQTTAEIAAGVTPSNYAYPQFNVLRYAVTNDGVDCTAALQAVANVMPFLFFPAGTYRITSTVTRMTVSRWVGEVPQMLQNGSGSVTPEVVIYGTVADIGNGNPMVRLLSAATQGSSVHTSNIGFKSNKSVNTASLSSMDSNGVNGVDISSVKNSVEFVGCSFDHMAIAVYQNPSDPFYVDQLILDRTHIQQCYLGCNAKPTVGINLLSATIFDCFSFIDSATDVTAVSSSLNNTSAASNTTGVKARNITWIGGWCEGGNNVFRPSHGLLIDGLYASEGLAVSGSKFLIGPRNDDVSITVRNTRIPTNTRLISLSGLTLSTISLTTEGLYDGTNFSDTASIASYVPGTLDYRGRGNKNAANWNWGWTPGSIYTPTVTGVANTDAATAFSCQYYSTGNVVTVSGKVNVDATAGATLTQVGISLPVASDLVNQQDCAGTAAAPAAAAYGAIDADTTNNRAKLNFISAGTANTTIMFQFTYVVN